MLLFSLPAGYLLGMAVWLSILGLWLFASVRCFQKWKSSPVRLRWLRTGIAAWSFLAMFTAIELLVATSYDQSDSFNMTNISKRWYALHVVKNVQGFRDDHPLTRRAPEGKRRLIFLGDSFTFGHGVRDVSQRFSDRTASLLELARPGEFEVCNLGSPGHGTPEAVATIRDLILEQDYQADMIVYTLCLNDIESFHQEKSQYDLKREQLRPTFFLIADTYFFNMVYFRTFQFTQPEIRDYFAHVRDYYDGPPWERMQDSLLELFELASKHQIPLRVLIFPFLHVLGKNYPFRSAHQKLVQFCHKHHVPVLDLEPILSRHSGESLIVNKFDAHPNSRAHELAALAMQQELLQDLYQTRNDNAKPSKGN